MTVVLFGTGTDYALFVSARFREELTRHGDRHEAMRQTMRGVGGAVASAGATILVASAALWFATLRSYQTLGPVIALAVALMMLAALTLIPAALTILGRRAFWPMQPRLTAGVAASTDWRTSIYGRIGGAVLARPRVVLAVTCAGLTLLTAGLLAFEPNYDQLESLPDNTESVRSFELLRTGFPGGELARTRVFVSLAPGEQALDDEPLRKLDAMTLALAEHPLVAGAAGPEPAVRRRRGIEGRTGRRRGSGDLRLRGRRHGAYRRRARDEPVRGGGARCRARGCGRSRARARRRRASTRVACSLAARPPRRSIRARPGTATRESCCR